MVKVYSIPDCAWCAKVKKYLDSKGVAYENVNVESDIEGRKEMIALTKQQSIPAVNIDGNIVIGFEKEQFDKLLNL
jgi:glutaredoxin 3